VGQGPEVQAHAARALMHDEGRGIARHCDARLPAPAAAHSRASPAQGEAGPPAARGESPA
jgi:hypothetical protein